MRTVFLNSITVLIQLHDWNVYYVVISFLQDPSLCGGTHLSESSQNASKVGGAKDLNRNSVKMSISITWQLSYELCVTCTRRN